MECIYIENLNDNDISISVPLDEAKHLKALRINSNEKILITNGKGLSAISTVERKNKNEYIAHTDKYIYNVGELNCLLSIAIGILDSKDRFEFAIEKCIELGVAEIFPLVLDYSQSTKINMERLIAKAISAIKQCKRSRLPKIHLPQTIDSLISNIDTLNYQNIFLADENGVKPQINIHNSKNSIIFVGAEGGFSERELNLFPTKTIKWNLGNRRLRAETAAISMLSILSQ